MEEQDNPKPVSITGYKFLMDCAACKRRRYVRCSQQKSGDIRAVAIGCGHSWLLSPEGALRLAREAKRKAKRSLAVSQPGKQKRSKI
jgi:hypothetical protein